MSSTKPVNPIVLRRGAGIGTGNAETDDDFLFDCFVEYPLVEDCRRIDSPAMVVAGRTGSGKTAILRYLEREFRHTSSIDPFEMSMSYVSNSDALRFLQAIGADLDLFFQALWKHVLCIEYKLNDTPRKCLDYRTPREVFEEHMTLQGAKDHGSSWVGLAPPRRKW